MNPTDFAIPTEIVNFGSFLIKAGLIRQRSEFSASFGNKLLQYGDDGIEVRIISERGIWWVELTDTIAAQSDSWYDAALLGALLLESCKDVLQLSEQIEIVKGNWPTIVDRFGFVNREETHSSLARIRRERTKRRFPELSANY